MTSDTLCARNSGTGELSQKAGEAVVEQLKKEGASLYYGYP